jgi:hypothetical protein
LPTIFFDVCESEFSILEALGGIKIEPDEIMKNRNYIQISINIADFSSNSVSPLVLREIEAKMTHTLGSFSQNRESG